MGRQTDLPPGRRKRSRFPAGPVDPRETPPQLSEQTEGVVELWQDGTKIVDRRGQTLPLAHTIYNSLEVGISAHSFGSQAATLFVDDLSISGQPLD